jgi:hypothetical protein
MIKPTAAVVGTVGPLLIDVAGYNIPALSMLMGLTSVVLVRIMFMARDFKNDLAFWYYNVSLTLLLIFIAFAIIADRQLGPGMAVMVGTGIGGSGMVLVDILKDKVENMFSVLFGKGDKE